MSGVNHIALKKFISAATAGGVIAAASVFVTRDSSVSIYEGDTIDIPAGFDEQDVKQQNTNPSNSFGFTLDTLGSGVAGTPPEIGIFLKAAGGKETVSANEVIYTKETVLDNIVGVDIEGRTKEPVSGKDYLYRTANAKGQVGITMSSSGKVDFIVSGFVGDYFKPVPVVKVEPDYGTQKQRLALPANADNVLVMQLDGKSICSSEFSLPGLFYAGGAERESLMGGCKSTLNVDGILDGSLTMKLPDYDVLNPYTYQELGEEIPFLITVGTEAGKMITVSCPRVQLLNIQDATIGRMSAKSLTPRFLAPVELKFH